MAKAGFEYCEHCALRADVAERLEWPPNKNIIGLQETPTGFWERVERAGLLTEGLALYDKLRVERKRKAQIRQETKRAFEERLQKEGRQDKAKIARERLLVRGLNHREVQEKLVALLQPLDGSATRAWQTPNPWNEGRLCQKKVEQDRLLLLNGKPPSKEDMERTRLKWAQHRLEERVALVAARAKARKAAPPKITNGPKAPRPSEAWEQ